MGKETLSVRPGQENDDKSQTENIVSSSGMKASEHSDVEEDGDNSLSSLSMDDIVGYLERLKIQTKQEEKEVLTARGKVYPSKVEDTYRAKGPHLNSSSHHRVYPVKLHANIYNLQNAPRFYSTDNRSIYHVEGIDDRCRYWSKQQHVLSNRGEWEFDVATRRNKYEANLNKKVSPGGVQKHKKQKDLNVPDGFPLQFLDDIPLVPPDGDQIDGNFPGEFIDLEWDCAPNPEHFSTKAWEEGIPKLDLESCDLMEIVDQPGRFLTADPGILDFVSPLSPYSKFPDYTPSPDRMDEVVDSNQDSNDKFPSPKRIQDDSETSAHLDQNGDVSPVYQISHSPSSESEAISPGEFTPEEMKKIEQTINKHLNDDYASDDQTYCDWITSDVDGDNLLHSCIIANNSTQFTLLLVTTLASEGILSQIIDLQNSMLRTALFLAVLENKAEEVSCLLKHGADPNVQGKVLGINDNYELRAPLHLVAERGDNSLKILLLLLDCERTDVDIRSESDRRTPLHLALLTHCMDKDERLNVNCSRTIEELIQYNADVELQDDSSSKTPVIMAIDTRDFSLVKTFLSCVESIDKDLIRSLLESCTRAGDTPLHIAAGARMEKGNKAKLIRLLVNKGANTHTENNIKQLPEDIASRDLWKAAFRC